MKVRAQLTADEVRTMLESLSRRLDSIGLRTQPGVAVRVLELSSQPEAGLSDYAKVIRTDASIVGRILKLANSAAFAQRQPVTSLDRACVLLGLERIKAIAVGFYLCRAAADPSSNGLSGRVWGQSVYRACLAAEAARLTVPDLVSEAFVIGLIQDAGIQLMPALVGREAYANLMRDNPPPGVLFERESRGLPFTHVDVIAALASRWRLPETLARPMSWHHQPPTPGKGAGSLGRLHRIAYFAGWVDLSGSRDASASFDAPCDMDIAPAQVAELVERATREYRLTSAAFPGATPIENLEPLAEQVQSRLISALDEALEALARRSHDAPLDLVISGQRIQICAEEDAPGQGVLYILDDAGERVLSHSFVARGASAESLLRAVAVDPPADRSVVDRIAAFLQRLAA